MSFWDGVLGNLVASFLFWLALGAIFWCLTRLTEKQLRTFFGLTEAGVVEVDLSNTSQDDPPTADGRVPQTLSLHESWAGSSVSRMFQRAPLRLSEIVRGLVDALWLRVATEVRVQVGTGTPNPDSNCLIVVGGTARNRTRQQLVLSNAVRAAMDWEWAGASPDPSKKHQVVIESVGTQVHEAPDGDLPALIERRWDPAGRMVFSCVGQRADGTWLAVEYLMRNWRKLNHEFKDSDFVLVLSTPNAAPMPTQYQEPKVLLRQRLG